MTTTVCHVTGSAAASAQVEERHEDIPGQLLALESTGMAVLLLSLNLTLLAFTNAAVELLELLEADRGLPLDVVFAKPELAALADDCHEALHSGTGRAREYSCPRVGATFNVLALPRFDMAGLLVGVTVTFSNAGMSPALPPALLPSRESSRAAVEIPPSFLFTATAELQWDYVSPLFYEVTGLSDGSALGEGWLSAVHPDDVAAVTRNWRAAAQAGIFHQEFRVRAARGSWRWFLGQAAPRQGQVRWLGSFFDIHERRRAQERQQFLVNELQHRVKNILAVVRAVLSRTLETSADLETFAAHFNGRFNAISRMQGVLARTADATSDLAELVSDEFDAQGIDEAEQITASGPRVLLPARTAQILALAIHELTTNALKFGALSVPQGRVSISWHTTSRLNREYLHLSWIETGLSLSDRSPERFGFGREIIERGVPYELQAVTKLDFRPEGTWCKIEFPLSPSETNLTDPSVLP